MVGSSVGAGFGWASGSTLGGAAGASPLLSPSPFRSAIGWTTFTPSVPSGTRIFAIVPSSTASNSIVALSVSISARMSPDFTASPSLTSHLASVPSSIVGDKAGILSSIGIGLVRQKGSPAQSQCGHRGQVAALGQNPAACTWARFNAASRRMSEVEPKRTYLVVVDDSAEARVALRFAARRAARTDGKVEVLGIMEPQ